MRAGKTVFLLFFILTGLVRADVMSDSTGAQVKLVTAPQRIVTLSPALGELAAEILGEDLSRIVGVSDRTDYPPALQDKPSVGSFAAFNLEKIIALKPDLILATMDGNPRDRVLQLRELGFPVVVVSGSSFAQIQEGFLLVGQALGKKEDGKRLSQSFEKALKKIHLKANQRKIKPRVVLQIGADPLVVAGSKSFLNEALMQVGAQNIYSDLKNAYPRPAFEDLVHRNPDLILILSMDQDLSISRREVVKWNQFKNLNAVKNRKIRVLQGDTLLRPSMRLLEGLALLEKTLFTEETQ